MTPATRVVHIGPATAFRGLEGRLIEAEDRATRQRRRHFQPERDAIMALPCDAEHVRAIVLAG